VEAVEGTEGRCEVSVANDGVVDELAIEQALEGNTDIVTVQVLAACRDRVTLFGV
jgi:hypothetical protein